MLLVGRFGEWLIQRLDERGWDKAELARRANTSDVTIGRIINGSRQVGPDVALGIARALGEPPETVFRQAGFLPSLPPAVAEEREVITILREQSPTTRRTILSMLRGLGRRLAAPGYSLEQVIGLLEGMSADDRAEVSRALKYIELNAHIGEPRIIGAENEPEREQAAEGD